MSTLAGSTIGNQNGVGTSAKFHSPAGVCVNNMGSTPTMMYVADTLNHAIRSIDLATFNVTTLAGAGVAGWADGVGLLARFFGPMACAIDSANIFMYVADRQNGAVRKIDLATSAVTTIIGNGCVTDAASCVVGVGCCDQLRTTSGCLSNVCYFPGAGTAASVYQPQSLVMSYVSPCSAVTGCLWVTNTLGTLSVVDLSSSPPLMRMAACFDPFGSSCVSCTSSGGCSDYSFLRLQGVTLDGAGNVFVAVQGQNSIWECAPAGSISSLASCARSIGQGTYFQYAEGSTTTTTTDTAGSWVDETVGLPLSAGLIQPWGLAMDPAVSQLFIADGNAMRLATFSSGIAINVTTVGGGAVKSLPGVAGYVHPDHWFPPGPDNVYLPSAGSADGVGAAAAFSSPSNVCAVHATRTLYIADTANHRVRSMVY